MHGTDAARSVERVLPHDPSTARLRAREHGLSERSNDVAVITPTVSAWDQHFAVLAPNADGSLDLRLAVDPDAVRAFYQDRVATWLLITAYGQIELQSPWHALVDTRGEMRMVATETVERDHVAVLFPTWTDGIIGEVMWAEPEWAPPVLDAEGQIELSRRLDAFDEAWRQNDTSARLELVEDDTRSVIRVCEVDGDHRHRLVATSKEELAAAWSSPDAGTVLELERRTRILTNFYAFASYRARLDVRGHDVEREIAALLPLGPNGRFIGEMSYGFEVALDEAPSTNG